MIAPLNIQGTTFSPRNMARSQIVVNANRGYGSHNTTVSSQDPAHSTRGFLVHITRTKADASASAPNARIIAPRQSVFLVNCALFSESSRMEPVQLKKAWTQKRIKQMQ